MLDKYKIKEFINNGWIKAWMIFEVQATSNKTTEESLKNHVKKMKTIKSIKILEEKYSKITEEEPIPQYKARGIKKVYSQVVEIVVLAQDFQTLVDLMITFAPSAIEVLEPEKITLTMRSAQNALSSIADIMHKFAAAGRGGVMISNA